MAEQLLSICNKSFCVFGGGAAKKKIEEVREGNMVNIFEIVREQEDYIDDD